MNQTEADKGWEEMNKLHAGLCPSRVFAIAVLGEGKTESEQAHLIQCESCRRWLAAYHPDAPNKSKRLADAINEAIP